MRKRLKFGVAALAASAAGCLLLRPEPQAPPLLADQCAGRGEPIDSAPLAVAGVIVDDRLVRRPVPMRSNPRLQLQLRRFRMRIENVLKGDLAPGGAEVFYYAWAGGFDGPRPLGCWRTGSRRIVLLRRDSGVLRTVCDGWDECTWSVHSGAHPKYRPDPARPLSDAIADILLTRGEGKIAADKFARSLDWPSSEYAFERLGHLAATQPPPVKTHACLTLWAYATGGPLAQAATNQMRIGGCACSPSPAPWPTAAPHCGAEARAIDPPF
jgi:hypothetical protein